MLFLFRSAPRAQRGFFISNSTLGATHVLSSPTGRYVFSGEYLSACDLSAALGSLLAGVARGDIKPRSARTLAYLSQTLVQTIHLAQHEYINALGTDAWRKSVRNSVKGNHD